MSYVGETLLNLLHQTAFFSLTWGNYVMIAVACLFLYLAIKKGFEPLLLVPIAFGGLLSNIPMPLGEEIAGPNGFLGIIFEAGIHKGLFPLIIFMGVGAMTDFGPLIANPKTALLGGAAQFGIFGALLMAYCLFGFSMPEAASIGISVVLTVLLQFM